MLADEFAVFLKELDNFDAPYIDNDETEIIVDGHIPKDKLERFLVYIYVDGYDARRDEENKMKKG